MNKFAIIVAAGSGTRMGSSTPKQFLLLKGKPVVWHTIHTFLGSFEDMEIILVIPQAHLDTGHSLLKLFPSTDRIRLVVGGETRFDSVKNGLALVEDPSIVFVHDGVRCLVSEQLIKNCYEETVRKGSAIPVIDSRDSVRLMNEKDSGNEAVDRSRIKFLQTPQTFSSHLIVPAYGRPYNKKFTDESMVVEDFGVTPNLIAGEEFNIKITTPLDMIIAEKLMDARL
jgi:2-C-methyl-D-erythritol 4-phosphate cytidylyltransferase